MENCLFCKIERGEIPSARVYEDDKILAFCDIAPQAPVHILIIPRTHLASMDEVCEENADIVAHIFKKIPEIAKMAGLCGGYRVISNCGPDACQSVKHLHFHILGGAQLGDRMG